MDSKGKGKSLLGPKPIKEDATGEVLAQFISYLQGLQVETSSSESQSSGEFQFSPIAKSRIGTQAFWKPGIKVLEEDSMKYWTALGGSKKIRRLREEESVLIPLYRSRGVVEASDLITGEKIVVLKNAGLLIHCGGSRLYQRQPIAHLLPHLY
jgi:hypothetical protein